jgi:hypothetical protein
MTQRTSIMGLRKMKSKFFGSASSSSASSSISASSSPRSGGPPPVPAISNISASGTQHTQQPSQRETQKSQKLPTQVTYVTNEMIRELRELIRYRYALDCKIWDIGRKARWYQRDTVITDMGRSDAALLAIKDTLSAWDRREYFETAEQHDRFREIKNRIISAETRTWAGNPPWPVEVPENSNGVHEKDGQPIHYVQRVSMGRPYPNGTLDRR